MYLLIKRINYNYLNFVGQSLNIGMPVTRVGVANICRSHEKAWLTHVDHTKSVAILSTKQYGAWILAFHQLDVA